LIEVKLENSNPAFESLFRIGNDEYQNVFEIVNKTNKIFKEANNLLKSIK